MSDILSALTKGTAGMVGTLVAIVTPIQEQIAWTLGCLVALGSFVSIVLDIRRKLREARKAEK